MTGIVHITLGKPRSARDDDLLGRSWLGYDSNRSTADNWKANRGAWKLDPARVERCDLAVFSHKGEVVLVDVQDAVDLPVPEAVAGIPVLGVVRIRPAREASCCRARRADLVRREREASRSGRTQPRVVVGAVRRP